jgi:hypothetical protein
MRLWGWIVLPDGTEVQSAESKTNDFWQRTGTARGADLTKLKAGHAKRIMSLARELYPDQVAAKH